MAGLLSKLVNLLSARQTSPLVQAVSADRRSEVDAKPARRVDTYNFRLDQHPSSYYVSRFQPEDIRIESDGGWVTIDAKADGPADLGFTVQFPITGGSVAKEHLVLARKVLNRVAEMDADARRLPTSDDFDYEENLASIKISTEVIEFTYAAGACNTSWPIYFEILSDGSFGSAKWTLLRPISDG